MVLIDFERSKNLKTIQPNKKYKNDRIKSSIAITGGQNNRYSTIDQGGAQSIKSTNRTRENSAVMDFKS